MNLYWNCPTTKIKNNMWRADSLLKKIIIALCGTFLAALGIHLLVLTTMGADALSTFLLGLLNYVPIRFGTASLLFNVGTIIVLFFFRRDLLGLGSLINGFCLGPMLNLLDSLQLGELPQLVLYSFVILGPVTFGLGTGLYLSAGLGSGPLECLMYLAADLLKLPLKWARMLLDAIFILSGFLLGGPVGISTLSVLLILGPMIEWTLKTIFAFQKKFS